MARLSVLVLLLLAACQAQHDASSSSTTTTDSASIAAAVAATPSAALPTDDIWHKDPCDYVSQAEAEVYLGPLLHAPYRGKDDHIAADSSGNVCVYRGKDGHNIGITVQWMDGKSEIKQYTGASFLNKFFVDDNGKTDTLSDAWDQAALRVGTLFALKGDTLFSIDFSGSNAGLPGATKLAEAAIGRLGKPLAYNSVAATRDAPGPLVAPRDPCTALTRADVEAVMGPLSADPHSEDGGACHYPTANGDVVLQVAWTNGFRALFTDRAAAHNAHSITNQQYFNMDSAFATMQKGMAKRGMTKQLHGVRGPAATDTTLDGPWTDSRLAGIDGTLEVVKKDVLMQLPFMPQKPEAPRALLTAAMNKI
jgi:hypothetical protein